MAYTYINEKKLDKALSKYTAFLSQEQDSPFTSFSEAEKRTETLSEEVYKEKNQKKAMQELHQIDWENESLGAGEITAQVFAIIRRRSPYLVNRFTVDSKEEKALKNLYDADKAFFDLYFANNDDEQNFKEITKLFGRNYSFNAFLFFIKGGHYLPISGNLSDSLAMIGVSFPINDRCSWTHYNEFIKIVEEIQAYINENGVDPNATLIQAHSFLWTYRYKKVQKGLPKTRFASSVSSSASSEAVADLELEQAIDKADYEPKECDDAPRKRQGTYISNGREVCRRSPQVAINAVARANYLCEIDPSHESFVRRSTKKNYVEAHHLIPLAYWKEFEHSIDVEANVVSLCSNCHNRIHHGLDADDLIKQLYNQRKERLEKAEIGIELDRLIKMYQSN